MRWGQRMKTDEVGVESEARDEVGTVGRE